MTPKEKANELYNKVYGQTPTRWTELEIEEDKRFAKQCTLIVVNEIIDAIDWHEFETPNKEINYWLDVRKEIEKL